MLQTRAVILAGLVCAALGGCETSPVVPDAQVREDAQSARAHYEAGDYGLAAQTYLRLAEATRGEIAAGYRLEAAAALARAGRPDEARRLLGQIGEIAPDGPLALARTLALAEIALAERRPDDALALLGEAPREDAGAEVIGRYHRIRADAHEAAGRHVESARERVALELVLHDPVELSRNRRTIWNTLSRLEPSALEGAHIPPPSTLGGWIELAAIAGETKTDPDTLERALRIWRNRYPGHPAGEEIVPMLLETSAMEWAPPRTVGLLLPLEGQFAQAAAAVRDGFMAAWFADADNERRPTVLVRSTSGADIWTTYHGVREEGAEFVVGPLRREAVSALARAPGVPLPTLALNQPDPPEAAGTGDAEAASAPTHGLYHFSLTPEWEARLVAERAWYAGHANAAVIAPRGAWGERVAEAFSAAWEALGGLVVETQFYSVEENDISKPVARLLDVDESQRRYVELWRTIGGELEHEPRRRQDVDFVFMAGFPQQARQIRPQLQFHRGQDLPVYATSHIYTGFPDAARDGDVEGVVFGDMPWVLAPDAALAELRSEVERLWPDSARAFFRLYAFGVDAYELVARLGRLRAQPYAEHRGATGRLSLDGNSIRRRLSWARFENGEPRLLDAASSLP